MSENERPRGPSTPASRRHDRVSSPFLDWTGQIDSDRPIEDVALPVEGADEVARSG